MFDFLIWSKIVRDSSLSNRPFFTHIYIQGTKKGLGLSRGRLSALPQVKFDQKPGCVTYTLSSRMSCPMMTLEPQDHAVISVATDTRSV